MREESIKGEIRGGEGEIGTHPLVLVDVKLVEGDMGGGDEDLLDEGVDPLEDGEVEGFGAVLVQIRRRLPVLRHLPRSKTLTLIGKRSPSLEEG